MTKSLLNILLFFGMIFALPGCYELRYFRHYPTHELLSKDIKKKDFINLKMFVDNGVLFLPNLKPLSDSHPHPYSQLFLVSDKKTDVYLCQAVIRDSGGETISSIQLNKQVPVNQPRGERMYKSLGVKLFDSNSVDIKEMLKHDVLYLNIYFSECDENDGSQKRIIEYKLEKRESKEIAWPT